MLNSAKTLRPDKTAVRQKKKKNSKIDGSYYFKANIFSHFEKESVSSIQFNGKIINIMLQCKVCINFYTQVFNKFMKKKLNFILKK